MPAITSPPEIAPDGAHRPSGNGGGRLRVLFVQHCPHRTGSTISGRLAVEGFLGAGWKVDAAFGSAGPMINEYERLGCRTHVVPHKNWLRSQGCVRPLRIMLAERRAAAGLVRLIRETCPDLVYVNSLVSLAGALAARQCGLPCVWHIREQFDDVGGEMKIPACGGRALVRRLVTGLSTRRVAISQAVKRNILGDLNDSRTEIVPNAVAEEFFELADDVDSCRRRFDLPRGVPIVGVPGTLRPVKGHAFFLEAAAVLARSRPDCVFAITGAGEPGYAESLHRQADRLGISGQVRFLGTVTEMPRFYRSCDMICVPSESESFGRTVIESMAIGTPVVATAVGGIRETIRDGSTGMLVPFGDVAGLAGTLSRLLRDSERLRQVARAAQSDVVRRFSSAAHSQRLIALVQSLCSSRT